MQAARSNSLATPAGGPRRAAPARRGAADDARIRQLVADLYTPLDRPPAVGRDPRQAAAERLRAGQDLERARAAARRAFKVRPSLSKRKAAAIIFSTGAMGLTAFTGPPAPTEASAQSLQTRSGKRLSPALLRASGLLKQALIEEEGVRHTVYRDVAGYPTVGVGHLVQPRDGLAVGDRISETQARAFLDADLRGAEAAARALLGELPVHQHEFDALVDLIYNVGPGNVSADKSPRLNRAIAAGDYQAIAAELEYTYAGGAYARGLGHRSERRAQMFRAASYEDPRQAIRVEA